MSKLRLAKRPKLEKAESSTDSDGDLSQSLSESSRSGLSSGDDLEVENDEFDDVGGSDSSENEDSDSDSHEGPRKDNQFARAVNAILGSKLKAHDRKDPILIRSKKDQKKLEESKLEEKARRIINAEKKAKLDGARVRELLPTDDSKARHVLEHEKALRKVAQRGVVKMFNAIHASQTNIELSEKVIGIDKQQKQMTDLSKEKFLDLIRSGGKKE